MSWGWAQPWPLPASCPGPRTLGLTPPGPGLLPPASALPSRLGQAWVSTCALTDLPVFGCPGAPHRPLQGEEGEGTGSEPGREGGWVEAGSPVGLGWTAWFSLPSAQPKLYPSFGGGGGRSSQGRAFFLLLQTPKSSGFVGGLNESGL